LLAVLGIGKTMEGINGTKTAILPETASFIRPVRPSSAVNTALKMTGAPIWCIKKVFAN